MRTAVSLILAKGLLNLGDFENSFLGSMLAFPAFDIKIREFFLLFCLKLLTKLILDLIWVAVVYSHLKIGDCLCGVFHSE